MSQILQKETDLLDELGQAVSNDFAEACTTRSSAIIRTLRLYPVPSPELVTSALGDSKGNSVLLLENLHCQMKSASSRINYNEKLLMSAVCYCELPLFLSCLSTALPPPSPSLLPSMKKKNSTGSAEASAKRQSKHNRADSNPYRTPVWCSVPEDWLAKRIVAEDAAERAPRPTMDPPMALSKAMSLGHVRSQLEEKPSGPDCYVLGFFQEHQKRNQLSNSNVTEIVKNLPRYSDVDEALQGILKFLAQRGMICCGYPQLLLHPVTQQYVKYYTGQVLTRDEGRSILANCKSAQRCIRELYTIPPALPVPLFNTPDSSWQHIEHVKRTARSQRRSVLNHVFRSRYAASQNFARSLHPEYKMVDGFLPQFAAYTINSHTHMTVWPHKGI